MNNKMVLNLISSNTELKNYLNSMYNDILSEMFDYDKLLYMYVGK